MKHNLLNFTRGSQLLGHFGFMFAAGLKGPLIVAVLCFAGLSWREVTGTLTDHQLYLVWMHLYAALYGFMEFDPAKPVALELASGASVTLPIGVLRDFPPMREAVGAFGAALFAAFRLSALILVPSFCLFWWIAERFGGRSRERRHERGAMLVTLPELEDEIARHNRAERAREMDAALGWKWRLAGSSALARAGFYTPSHLADVEWPWRLEQSHTMLVGTTGTGKTVALSELLAEARSRGQRAVVFDLTGAFIEAFFDPTRDVILNPLDARCPSWSVFNDCTSEGEFHAAAEALVPHDGGGAEQFWVLAARMLFVEMCLHLKRAGTATNEALASRLMTADLAQVHKLMRGTMADPLTAPEAARMAESIRAVFNANAKALKLLPSGGQAFSIRDWTKGDSAPGSVLFLSARYVDLSICSQLLTLWLDTAMNTLMSMERTGDLRLWFLVDELGALHRLPALEKGLQTARNFGGAIVVGVHAFAKLKEVYGENMAMTLSSLARTKLILATADRETATWCSDFIGHRQVRDMEEGYSYGYNNARDAVSLTPRRQIEPLLLPDQFMNLPRLSGYLKFPDGFPAAPVSLEPRTWPRIAEGFIAREPSASTPPTDAARHEWADGEGASAAPAGGSEEHPAANDDGAGKPVVPSQLTLAYRDLASDEPREHEPDRPIERAPLGVVPPSAGPEETGTPTGMAIAPTDSSSLPLASVVRAEGAGERERDPGAPEPANGRPAGAPEGKQASGDERRDRERAETHRRRQERDLLDGAADPPRSPDLGEFEPDL